MTNQGRMGHAQYARILAAVMAEQMTHEEVAAKIWRGKVSVRQVLYRLHHMGVLRIAGWAKPAIGRGIYAARFAYGAGENAPYPGKLKNGPMGEALKTSRPRPELISFVSIVRCLQEGATRAEIGEQTGVAHHVLSRLLQVMRKELGIVHVSSWQIRPDGMGQRSEVLTFGPGRDAAKPRRMCEKKRSALRRVAEQQRTAMSRVLHAMHGLAAVTKNGVQTYGTMGASRWDLT